MKSEPLPDQLMSINNSRAFVVRAGIISTDFVLLLGKGANSRIVYFETRLTGIEFGHPACILDRR